MNKEDLDLMSTDDLIAVLARRYDGHYFLGMKDLGENKRQIYRGCGGDLMVLTGQLVQGVVELCVKNMSMAQEPAE